MNIRKPTENDFDTLTHLYSWANTESKGGILDFMKKEGFAEGHLYRWIDKKI